MCASAPGDDCVHYAAQQFLVFILKNNGVTCQHSKNFRLKRCLDRRRTAQAFWHRRGHRRDDRRADRGRCARCRPARDADFAGRRGGRLRPRASGLSGMAQFFPSGPGRRCRRASVRFHAGRERRIAKDRGRWRPWTGHLQRLQPGVRGFGPQPVPANEVRECAALRPRASRPWVLTRERTSAAEFREGWEFFAAAVDPGLKPVPV